jgi:hypothetical protein
VRCLWDSVKRGYEQTIRSQKENRLVATVEHRLKSMTLVLAMYSIIVETIWVSQHSSATICVAPCISIYGRCTTSNATHG